MRERLRRDAEGSECKRSRTDENGSKRTRLRIDREKPRFTKSGAGIRSSNLATPDNGNRRPQ